MSATTKKSNGNTAAAGKKRKYQNWSHRNPRRGGPGVLMTCETGREVKCQREGMDILNHYCCCQSTPKDEAKDPDSSSALSLEEELKVLRTKKGANASSMFGVYDTGCRGSVFVMCTKPGCNIIPAVKVEDDRPDKKSNATENDTADKKESTNDSENGAKKPRLDAQTPDGKRAKSETDSIASTENPWDPVDTVRTIIEETEQHATSAPGSRFVTRMIPIQATCFASAEEIRLTSQALLKKVFAPHAFKTFAIAAQRRICNNISRKEIIDTVAEIVLELNPKCKVDLDNPEATIVVEICRTLCGISVVPNCHKFHHFNLMSAREANNNATTTEGEA